RLGRVSFIGQTVLPIIVRVAVKMRIPAIIIAVIDTIGQTINSWNLRQGINIPGEPILQILIISLHVEERVDIVGARGGDGQVSILIPGGNPRAADRDDGTDMTVVAGSVSKGGEGDSSNLELFGCVNIYVNTFGLSLVLVI